MFCSNCGKEIDDKAVVCVHCGCSTSNLAQPNKAESKSWVAALLLCLFLGGFGAHRFYVGKTGSAVAILLINLLIGWLVIPLVVTGIWILIDFINICIGGFKTADGRDLVK